MNNVTERPAVMPVRERARVVNELTLKRFETLLPEVMRETGFDMWLIICHEDNHDPIFNMLIPWECWAPILQMVVFYDRGPDAGVERLNISRTDMQGLMSNAWDPEGPDDQWAVLRQIVEERQPKRIGINQSATIWAADGLTAGLKESLVEALGPDLSSRLESSESLAIRWIETIIPDELVLYEQACDIAHWLIRTCFSRQVITPGVTTTQDLRWWYWQAATDLGLPLSFPAFFNIFRSNAEAAKWGPDDRIIRPGDMLHCDVGVKYLRLITDHQELAYVLRPGETEAPAGLREGLAQSNRLQDIFTESWQYGQSGNEILKTALQRARDEGLHKPKIYSHSLGHFLHEPGPLMGLPWEQDNCPGRGDVRMSYNTCYTVELNSQFLVPEWDNQEVRFPVEQDAAYTKEGVFYINGRQTAFHLV